MAIHIDYDREENKIELILDSQGNVISTLVISCKILLHSAHSTHVESSC